MIFPSVRDPGAAHLRPMRGGEREDYATIRRWLRSREGGEIHDDWMMDQLPADDFAEICAELGVSVLIARLAFRGHIYDDLED